MSCIKHNSSTFYYSPLGTTIQGEKQPIIVGKPKLSLDNKDQSRINLDHKEIKYNFSSIAYY
jgi:hypothetical protein